MATGDIETRRINGRWVNVVMGSYLRQAQAIDAGEEIAKKLGVEHFGRSSRTGRWFRRNTYPRIRDPRRTKG